MANLLILTPLLVIFLWKLTEIVQPTTNKRIQTGAEMETKKADVFYELKRTNITKSDHRAKDRITGLRQDSPRLVQYIRSNYLHPPSGQPYNLSNSIRDPSRGQTKHIRKLLKDQKGGFFVECGGLDGETRSNTLFFEKSLGWKGLIIEGDPKNFQLLKKKNRKAWTLNGCLSLYTFPIKVKNVQDFDAGKKKSNLVYVQCLPLYSILLALNTTTVDYFSLAVQGDELKILKTIPWEKVTIRTLSIEYIHIDEGKSALKKYLKSKRYIFYKKVSQALIFYSKDLVTNNRE